MSEEREIKDALKAMQTLHERIYSECNIPEATRETIDNYVKHGLPPGSFTHAVLANDLMQAFAKADIYVTQAMPAIVSYVYNKCPHQCHGSYEAVDAWIEHGGLENRPRRRSGETP